jgi:hypothetical protein
VGIGVYVDGTPIETYAKREEAEEARRRVLVDDPDGEHVVTVERLEFVVSERLHSVIQRQGRSTRALCPPRF